MEKYKFYCEGDTAYCPLDPNHFLDDVEEKLYILWELEPLNRDWREKANDGTFAASYHGTEFFTVTINKDLRWVVVTKVAE